VRVSDEQYQRARLVAEEWKKKDAYKLREQDCISFAGAVAEALGLQVPDRGVGDTKLPAAFVRDMTTVNSEHGLLSGVWECVEAEKVRFRLEIDGKAFTWIDNPPEGQQISITGTLPASPEVRLERPNDHATLLKLGIKSAVADAMVAQKVKPSALTLRRTPEGLTAKWKGVKITKDTQGKLKDILYPERDVEFVRRLPK
jgi:hypothetical protein